MDDRSRQDRRALRHAATRAQILDAAWRLAHERGLTGWSLREVADVVNMRAPSLYVYFASKDAIYDAMFAQGYEQLLAQLDQWPDSVDDAVELLRLGTHSFVEFCVEDPARFQLLFLRVIPGFEPSPSAYRLSCDTLERLRSALVEVGLTTASQVDLWTAVFTGLASQQVSNDPGGDRWTRLVDDTIDLVLAFAEPVKPQALSS